MSISWDVSNSLQREWIPGAVAEPAPAAAAAADPPASGSVAPSTTDAVKEDPVAVPCVPPLPSTEPIEPEVPNPRMAWAKFTDEEVKSAIEKVRRCARVRMCVHVCIYVCECASVCACGSGRASNVPNAAFLSRGQPKCT